MTKPSTILIVDDDKTVIEQLTIHFRRRGYEPIATANPAMVEQILEGFEVHLILLDLRMERINGYDILRKLKDKNIHIPVLIITAYFGDEKERLEQVGILEADVIEKPFRDFSKIESKINRKLSGVINPREVGSDYEDAIYLKNKTKLVIVDDDSGISEILKDTFEARNYNVTSFASGDEALAHILSSECHVLIIDMKIPKLSGEDLIEKALAAKPHLKIIPVSGAYVKEMRDLLGKIGFDSKKLITKPFDLATLVENVKVYSAEAGTLIA